MSDQYVFTENILKGKVLETIFELMFRNTKKFTVIPLGYEKTTPILAQYNDQDHVRKVLENIRNAPDFALLTEEKDDVLLVEVKYRHFIYKDENLKVANELIEKWAYCSLFMADEEKFYFSTCEEIIKNDGIISLLNESWIDSKTQEKYHKLMMEFLPKSPTLRVE